MTGLCRINARCLLACLLLGGVSGHSQGERGTSLAPGGQTPARTLQFPEGRSLGQIYVADPQVEEELNWLQWGIWRGQLLGEARGTLTLPAGKRATLFVSAEGWQDLSPLSALNPDALDGIVLYVQFAMSRLKPQGRVLPKPDASCMGPVCHLTGLKLLVLDGTEIARDGLAPLVQLKSLERLSVLDKQLDADGVAVIGQVSSLKGLRIGSEVVIPPEKLTSLWNLSNLETLAIAWRRLDREAFDRLASLPHLTRLSLPVGLGSDQPVIPQVLPPNLEDLWLDCRELPESADLSSLSRLSGLKVLDLEEMKITEIASQIADAPALTELSIEPVADIPLGPLARLRKLERLKVHAHLTDSMLQGIEESRSMKSFMAGASFQMDLPEFTDQGVACLARIRSLEEVMLYDGSFTDKSLECFSTNPNIQKLLIPNDHGFTDQGMSHLLNLVRLEQLDLRGELLTLIGFERIAGLRNLKRLEFLQATQLDNQALARLATLPQLRSLKFSSQAVTTAGVTQLKSLKDLVELEAEHVRPDGTVLDISALSQLETLKIHKVSDDDLACLEGLKSLKKLEIAGPGLTDKGLSHLRPIPSLQVLEVGTGNQVTEEALKALGKDKPGLTGERIRSAP